MKLIKRIKKYPLTLIGLGVTAAAGAAYAVSAFRKRKTSRACTQREEKGWDAVDEASLESFPASDPPSNW